MEKTKLPYESVQAEIVELTEHDMLRVSLQKDDNEGEWTFS